MGFGRVPCHGSLTFRLELGCGAAALPALVAAKQGTKHRRRFTGYGSKSQLAKGIWKPRVEPSTKDRGKGLNERKTKIE